MLLQPVPSVNLERKENVTLNSLKDPQHLPTISPMTLQKADLFYLRVYVSMQNPIPLKKNFFFFFCFSSAFGSRKSVFR